MCMRYSTQNNQHLSKKVPNCAQKRIEEKKKRKFLLHGSDILYICIRNLEQITIRIIPL